MSAAQESSQPGAVQVKSGVVPYLQVDGAAAAAEFYAKAFGAEEAARHPLDEKGRTMHIHLYINDASVMLSDPYPEYGHPHEKAQGFSLTLQVDDIEPWWNRAVAAGATVVVPVERMFWGSRYGQLRDPFGVLWAMNEKHPG